jgi:hypothetical protein
MCGMSPTSPAVPSAQVRIGTSCAMAWAGTVVGGAPVDVYLQALRAGQDNRLSFRELVADDPETDRT